MAPHRTIDVEKALLRVTYYATCSLSTLSTKHGCPWDILTAYLTSLCDLYLTSTIRCSVRVSAKIKANVFSVVMSRILLKPSIYNIFGYDDTPQSKYHECIEYGSVLGVGMGGGWWWCK